MAKKFAAINGFHHVYNTIWESSIEKYDVSNITTDYKDNINKNTLCFVVADSEDVNKYVGDFKIKENDKFIITQENVFAYTEKPSAETWRAVLINGETKLKNTSSKAINFTSSDNQDAYFNVDCDDKDDYLSVYFNLNTSKFENYIKSFVKDAKLYFQINNTAIQTTDGEKETNQNTIAINNYIAGNFECFSSNQAEDNTLGITYTGNADKTDWFVENNTNIENNSSAKKFVYIDSFSNYFNKSGFPEYSSLNDEGKKIISENSIVFVTCGDDDYNKFAKSEFQEGARFIWTNGKIFSANTWGPIDVDGYLADSSSKTTFSINPVIGYNNSNYNSGKITLTSDGGIKLNVTYAPNSSDATICIDGRDVKGSSGSSETTISDGVATYVNAENNKTTINVNREPSNTIVENPGSDIPADLNNKTHGNNNPNDNTTEESLHDSKKNFLKIHKDRAYTWAEVNGIDSDAIYFSERIPFGNTTFSEFVLDDIVKNSGGTKTGSKGDWKVTGSNILENYAGAGKEKDNLYIQKGVTLHDFLKAIMHTDLPDNLQSYIILSSLDYSKKLKTDTITETYIRDKETFEDIDFEKSSQNITINDKTVTVYINKYDTLPKEIKPTSIFEGVTENLYELILCVPASTVEEGQFLTVTTAEGTDITSCPGASTLNYNYLQNSIKINGEDYRIWYRYLLLKAEFNTNDTFNVKLNSK